MLKQQMYTCKTKFFDNITESPEVISANVLVGDLNEVKVEPENFQDCYRNPSKENEVISNNSKSLQCVDKYPENRTSEFEIFI